MVNIQKLIEEAKEKGYRGDKASAKVCQDIDFIKYSLTDESIDTFISKLNCLDGIKISRLGKIDWKFMNGMN